MIYLSASYSSRVVRIMLSVCIMLCTKSALLLVTLTLWLQMVSERSQLPIADSHDEILDAIQQNQVVLIRGETGSGKTTQVMMTVMCLDELQCVVGT